MFIEKISVKNKSAYFQKLVEQFNTNKSRNDNKYLRPVNYSDSTIKIMKENGVLEKTAELFEKNIFCGIYENFSQQGLSLYADQFAMIVTFGDTTVKKIKVPIDRRPTKRSPFGVVSDDDYMLMDITRTFAYIDKNLAKLEHQNPLATNADYVNEFMIPNLCAIDKEQGTHLVADYKTELVNKFAKKRQFVLRNLQKQQDDLFRDELKPVNASLLADNEK